MDTKRNIETLSACISRPIISNTRQSIAIRLHKAGAIGHRVLCSPSHN